MPKCYGWRGTDGLGNLVLFLSCADSPGWTPNPVYGGNYSFPSDGGVNLASSGYGAKPAGNIIFLKEQSDVDNWLNGSIFEGEGCRNCLGDCPPGFCKCITPEYPGYCCLDCSKIAQQIREITNSLRLKNG